MPAWPLKQSRRQLVARTESTRTALTNLLIGNLVLGIMGFATSSISSRLLGTSGRGELARIQNVPNLLAVLGMFGMSEAALYFSSKNRESTGLITAGAVRIALKGSIIAIGLGLIVTPLLLSGSTRTNSLIYLLVIPITAVYTVSYQQLRVLGYSRQWTLFRVSVTVGWLGCLGIGALMRPVPAGRLAVLFIGAQACIALVAWRMVRSFPSKPIDISSLKKPMVRYGVPAALVTLPQVMNLRLDQILLGSIVAKSQLGLYVAAVGWSWIAAPPFHTLAQFILPRIAATTSSTQRIKLVRQALLAAGALGVTLSIILVPLTRRLFPLVMGKEFQAGVHVATLLVVASVISGTALVAEEIMKGLGQPRRVLFAELGGLSITLMLLALTLKRHGITGATWASIGGYSATLMAVLVQLPRALDHAKTQSALTTLSDTDLPTP